MGGLNPNLVSALAPFVLVEVGAEIGAELDNKFKIPYYWVRYISIVLKT